MFVNEGAAVKAFDKVLQMNPRRFELRLKRLNAQLSVLKMAQDKLTPSYLDHYIYGPLQELIKLREDEVGTAEWASDQWQTQNRFVGVDGDILEQANASVAKTNAEHQNALNQLDEKKREIAKRLADNKTDYDATKLEITQLESLINGCVLHAPRAGKIVLHAMADTFVEKGDLLFEVA